VLILKGDGSIFGKGKVFLFSTLFSTFLPGALLDIELISFITKRNDKNTTK